MKKMIGMVALAFMLASGSGCVSGNNGFALTKKLYKWNKNSMDNRWWQEVTFVGFCIIPVYGVCVLADAIVLNSIDFWSGSNPMASTTIEVDGHLVTLVKQADGSLVATSDVGTFRCVRDGEHIYAYDLEGKAYQVL